MPSPSISKLGVHLFRKFADSHLKKITDDARGLPANDLLVSSFWVHTVPGSPRGGHITWHPHSLSLTSWMGRAPKTWRRMELQTEGAGASWAVTWSRELPICTRLSQTWNKFNGTKEVLWKCIYDNSQHYLYITLYLPVTLSVCVCVLKCCHSLLCARGTYHPWLYWMSVFRSLVLNRS